MLYSKRKPLGRMSNLRFKLTARASAIASELCVRIFPAPDGM